MKDHVVLVSEVTCLLESFALVQNVLDQSKAESKQFRESLD